MKVPFLDLQRINSPIKKQLMEVFSDVIDSSSFAGGRYVEKFETDFAKYCQTNYAAGVSSGTDAIKLALRSSNIRSGDEVIIPANTFIATAGAISSLNAKPVLVDVEKDSHLIDTTKIEDVITDKTKAIIPVHLYGQIADMDQINYLAKKYNLKVIEDACQAHGATYNGKKAGSIGDIGCFSFYPGKNLGALGEGGACTTNSEELFRMIQILKNHGSSKKYYHDITGYNDRLHGIQGAFLEIKLKGLDTENEGRLKVAQEYNDRLNSIEGIILPKFKEDRTSSNHLYVIQVENREKVMQKLEKMGVQTGIHYPIPIHLHPAYKHLDYKKGDFPIAEHASQRILSLPMFGTLRKDEVSYVCESLEKIIGEENK